MSAMSDDDFPLSELQDTLLAAGPDEPLGKKGYAIEVTSLDLNRYFAVVTVKGKLGPDWASDFAKRLRAAAEEAEEFDEWTLPDYGTGTRPA
jgi:hypothetical protein